MSELDNLSEEQIVKMISAKKMGHDQSPDYSQQYKRNIGDSLRDLAYGGVEGLWQGGKLGGNLLTGGNLEKIPGYKQYIPFAEKLIDKIKSPNPSPAGDALKVAGEFVPSLIPVGRALRGANAVQAAARRIPSITRRGMERPYAQALTTAAEEGAGGLSHPPEVMQQIEQFLQSQNVPVGTRLQRASAGEYGGARDVRSTLGQLSRALPYNSGERIGAANLHADLGNSTLSELERLGFHRTAAATRHADTHYAQSARLRELLTEAAKHATGYSSLKAIFNLAKRI